MTAQKFSTGTEAQADALQAAMNKGLGYPLVGTHIGGGLHVTMPASWNGTGSCPPGWTKHVVGVWRLDALNAGVPIADVLAALLQSAPVQALLSAPEQTALAAAIAARVSQDLDALLYVQKPVP
jgi:hypothetical protein